MNTERTREAVNILVECQEYCAPITLTLGDVRNGVIFHGGVSISDAPPVAIEVLIKNGFSLSMEDGALHIDKSLPVANQAKRQTDEKPKAST